MTAISAIIITLNEARNIGRCLDSIAGVADEVIVVDSHSTDDTVAICKAKGAQVIVREWEGYSATKNFANAQASHRYILSLDADEALDDQLRESILKVKSEGLKGIYGFNRLTNYCGSWIRHCGWYPDIKLRLFPREGSRWEGEFVHEAIVFDRNHAYQHLAGDLLHYSYYTREEHLSRVEKYTTLAAEKLKANGKAGGSLKGAASAFARFVRMYLFQGGFLDGAAGWHVCRISAKAVLMRYQKLAKLNG